jgi:hypothetical protein
MKVKRLVTLVVCLFVLGCVGCLFLITRESPQDKALKERAITEVQMRISPNSAFQSIVIPNSESFYSGLCDGTEGFTHRAGVIEFIDTTSPSVGRTMLKFCVNTDNWQIQFQNDLARAYMVDNSAYLSAKSRCFILTDPKNKARMDRLIARYGNTFLRVDPSSENTSSQDFACTSSFDVKDSVPAVWKTWPNASTIPALIPDTPFTEPARQIERELETRKTSRCEALVREFSFDRLSFVKESFGGDPELRMTNYGYDADDPNLECVFTYWDEDSSGRVTPVATWSAFANSSSKQIKAADDDARKIDQSR